MVVLIFLILFIFSEPAVVISYALNTYCSLPCPFMGPAPPPCGCRGPPTKRPHIMARSSFYDNIDLSDYEEVSELPTPSIRGHMEISEQSPETPSPGKLMNFAPNPPTPSFAPRQKPEDSEPPRERRKPSSSTPSPSPATSSPNSPPTKRFFASLFSIPGAIVDTLISGEIVI